MNLSFIGAGNVALSLARSLENAGNSVVEVFSRTPNKAKEFVSYLYNARVQEHLDFSDSKAQVFFLCIPENAYPQVLPELLLPKYATLVLVSGCFSLMEATLLFDPNRESSNAIGVLYPVQRFLPGKAIKWEDLPICVEGLTEEVQMQMAGLAKSISSVLYAVSTEERKKIHLACLMAGTFTQLLWEQAQALLHSIELDQSLIEPLLKSQLAGFLQQQAFSSKLEKQQFADGRLAYEQQTMLEGKEMQEIYQQMLHLIRRNQTP